MGLLHYQLQIFAFHAQDARVIKSGELSRKVSVRGIGVTKGAKQAIEAAGGTIVDAPKADGAAEAKADEKDGKKSAKKAKK